MTPLTHASNAIHIRIRLALALLFLTLTPTLALAQPSANASPAGNDRDRGLEIAQEADRRDAGFGDFTADLSMILRNRHGEESTRKIRSRNKEVIDDGDKALIIFDEPRDVKGTAFLNHTHATGPDDQWLFLPALKRVKRISSKNKSGPFMGSEFAYEDIASQEVGKYTYTYLHDEKVDGIDHFVIERVPTDKNSGYTRQAVWYDKAEYRMQKVDYYDRKGDLLKTLTYHEYQQYVDQFWRAGRMEMVNHQTGKSTTLMWRDYAFQVGLTDRDFDQNSLKRAR